MKSLRVIGLRQVLALGPLFILASLFSVPAFAGIATAAADTAGSDVFEPLYEFVYAAATGYLGRSIAIVAGIIGLGIGAGSGKAIPAIVGIILALFGVFGPVLVNAIFDSAII